MRLKAKIWIFALIWFVQGCSTCEPEAEDYDRSCQADEDCVVAFLHRDCECSEVTAINKRDEAQLAKDNADARESEWCPTGQVECDLAQMEAYCSAGTCQARVVEGQP